MGLGQLLFSGVGNIRIDQAWLEGQILRVSARTTGKRARCPCCGCRSRRRHSRYQRTIGDLACGGRRVMIHLQARRFWCLVRRCAQKVFCERLPDLAAAWARRSRRLQGRLRDLTFRLGGEAGSRQAAADRTPVSGRTLLRLLRATQSLPAGAVRVLGIDDWARRKGHTYGTILVDLERHRVIDLLADRTAGTVATWLKAHPEVEIISCQWPSESPRWWPRKVPAPEADCYIGAPPGRGRERASRMRKESPSVTTVTAWWSNRSIRETAVACSGRKRPH